MRAAARRGRPGGGGPHQKTFRALAVQDDVLAKETSRLGEAHPRIRHQRNNPPKIIVETLALPLDGSECISGKRDAMLHPRPAVEIDASKGVGHRDAKLAGGEVDDGPDRPKDTRDAAAREPALDQCDPEAVRICLRVGPQVLVAAYVDHVAARPLGGPVEDDGTSLPLQAQVDRDRFRELHRIADGLRGLARFAATGQPQSMLPGQLRVFDPKMVPEVVQLNCGTSGPRRRHLHRPRPQRIGDLPGIVVPLNVPRDPSLEVVDAVFGKRERDRNVICHVLRPRSFLKKLRRINMLARRVVPGGGIEPPTRGFSIHCSTPELPGHG